MPKRSNDLLLSLFTTVPSAAELYYRHIRSRLIGFTHTIIVNNGFLWSIEQAQAELRDEDRASEFCKGSARQIRRIGF